MRTHDKSDEFTLRVHCTKAKRNCLDLLSCRDLPSAIKGSAADNPEN
jgi:hypothetical protein